MKHIRSTYHKYYQKYNHKYKYSKYKYSKYKYNKYIYHKYKYSIINITLRNIFFSNYIFISWGYIEKITAYLFILNGCEKCTYWLAVEQPQLFKKLPKNKNKNENWIKWVKKILTSIWEQLKFHTFFIKNQNKCSNVKRRQFLRMWRCIIPQCKWPQLKMSFVAPGYGWQGHQHCWGDEGVQQEAITALNDRFTAGNHNKIHYQTTRDISEFLLPKTISAEIM